MAHIVVGVEKIEYHEDGTATVTKTSAISHKVHSMRLKITPAQWDIFVHDLALIQDVFPHLTAPQREFVLTGITPEEWGAYLKEDDKP